jgi:hypothetical protein
VGFNVLREAETRETERKRKIKERAMQRKRPSRGEARQAEMSEDMLLLTGRKAW